MRPPAKIKPWLSTEKMIQWVQDAGDEGAFKRRKVIWLTHTKKLHAGKVAVMLGVSVQAVWLWIRQYNAKGPKGLQRKGRGGRRWGFMNLGEESQLLKPFIRQARLGKSVKAEVIKKAIEKNLGRKVSLPYIYKLLRRHAWSEIIAQSSPAAKPSISQDTFQKFSRPWEITY